MKHIRLSELATKEIPPHVKEAADKIADEGGSPRAQLDAARSVSSKTLGYISHQGARQRARNLARMKKKNTE